MGRRTAALVLVLAGLALASAPTTAAAAAAPTIQHIRPAAGEVVTGTTRIIAVLSSPAGVSRVTVFQVDGIDQPYELDTGRGLLDARLDLDPGHHIAHIEFRDGDGHLASRLWRFGVSGLRTDSVAGADRLSTAVEISRSNFSEDGSAPAVVLARSDDFPDALAAAPLAVHVGGPLLLTPSDGLASATAAELSRVLTDDATVHLLGGEQALSDEVVDDVGDLGFDVVRHSGPDRAGTAAAVARVLAESTTAVVAAGAAFADALAVAAPAAREGLPILLTGTDELSAATEEVLRERDFDEVLVVGGPEAVSADVVEAIGRTGARVRRLAGDDRYETAATVVEHFGGTSEQFVLASGQGFADALAGGPYAARLGWTLHLSRSDGLPPAQSAAVAATDPVRVRLLGGPAALHERVRGDLHRAMLGHVDGPREVDLQPVHSAVTNSLSTIEIGFDRDLELAHSVIHATIDGAEITGRTVQGDFRDHLVFQTVDLPFTPEPGIDHTVDVYAAAFDGEHWRHIQYAFTYRKLDLGRGDTGPVVVAIQNRLTELGYWLGRADGTFGFVTSQAIMAFQKYEGLPRTGEADTVTRERLEAATRPVPRATNRSGRWVEIDKTRQVMMFIVNGHVEWAMNTSTGTETYYTRRDGSRGFAHTPEGWFTFNRQIDGMREAELGRLWRPKYFTSAGHAIHGSGSIPAHPASHGCARLSNPAIDFVWAADLAPLGTPLFIYR
ncbi:MAG: cell wall-binding repeat-containing protein [Actinobacteria bacterium]|nr:cell wall-binding repeat-containing protein [Actinomycetota bacterium]